MCIMHSLLKNLFWKIFLILQISPKEVSSPQPFFNPTSALATAAAQQLAVATSTNPLSHQFFQPHDMSESSKNSLQSSPVTSASLSGIFFLCYLNILILLLVIEISVRSDFILENWYSFKPELYLYRILFDHNIVKIWKC